MTISANRAIVYQRPREFELLSRPVAEPGPGEVILKIIVAGVCGTDLHLHIGEFGPVYPLTPGHEFVGEVVAVGDHVDRTLIGHQVVVDNQVACGSCSECRRAQPVHCRNQIAQGVNAPGGMADYVITDADRCYLVDDLDPFVAVLTEPVACVIHGLDVLRVAPGSDVLLFGAGPTGLIMTSLLINSGAVRLTVAAPTQAKLDLARARGADQTVRMDRSDPQGSSRKIAELAPDGFDVVIDATGAADVLAQTIPLTRTGGTIFVYGVPEETAIWQLPTYQLFSRGLTITSSSSQQYSFDRALTALRTGRVDPGGLITHRFGLDQYGAALDAVSDSQVVKAVIVP